MKRIVSIMLVCLLVFGTMACGKATETDGNEAADNKTEETGTEVENEGAAANEGTELPAFKIGVAVGSWDAKALMTQSYYDKYIGPAFHVEFIWAEETGTDVAKVLDFVDTLASMGADAFIDYGSLTGDQLMAIGAKCNEYGIWYVNNNASVEDGMMQFEYFGGTGGAEPSVVGDQFYEMTEYLVADGNPHNIILQSEGALNGVAQHIFTASSALQAICEVFDLTLYTDNYEEIVTTTTAQTVLDTGSDMKVALETSNPADADSYYNLLKTGEYDTVIFQMPQYLRCESVIDEVEKTFGENIHLISIAPVADTTYNSFSTQDSTGNQALDAALIKNNSAGGILFAMAYNCLTGHADDMKTDGVYELYDAPMWVCYNLEEYEKIAQLDSEDGQYFTYRIDDLKEMLFEFNPELTADKLHELAASVVNLEMVLERNGLN